MSKAHFSNMDASLRSYSEFVRNLPVALYRATVEGRIAFCNDPFARIFGFESVNDAIGFPEIKLYRNKKDRGTLVQAVIRRGLIIEKPMAFERRDRRPIWCSVTTKATLDDDGEVVFLDGLVRDITGEIEDTDSGDKTIDGAETALEAVLVFDPQGLILEASPLAAKMLGCQAHDLPGQRFVDYLADDDQQLFFIFIGDVIRIGREEVILKSRLHDTATKCFGLHASVVKTDGRARKVNCVMHDVTERMQQIKDKTNRDKFQGVLEMAGGVAHRFNQPLTIVNNLINEALSKIGPDDHMYDSMLKMQSQVQKLNDITRKVGNIKKYEAVDYVAGIKIVDIDRAS
jgi:PAS domain S-box-containing protein